MHFHLLFLALTFLFTPSLTSPSDILYIQKLTADFSINLDTKNYKALDTEFLPTATYDAGSGVVTGLPNIKKLLSGIVANAVTQGSITTQSISLSPQSFDTQGSASEASAATYGIVTNIGQGKNAGKVFTVYGLWKDKLVKMGNFAEYGGWRFSARVFQSLVSATIRGILQNSYRLNNYVSGHVWRPQCGTTSTERKLKARYLDGSIIN